MQSPSFDILNRLACYFASREAVVRIICNCALVFILLLRFLLSPVHPIPEPQYHYPGTILAPNVGGLLEETVQPFPVFVSKKHPSFLQQTPILPGFSGLWFYPHPSFPVSGPCVVLVLHSPNSATE